MQAWGTAYGADILLVGMTWMNRNNEEEEEKQQQTLEKPMTWMAQKLSDRQV